MKAIVSRTLTVIVGTCAIAWAVQVFPFFRAEVSLTDLARRIISGENFSSSQFDAIRSAVDDATAARLDSSNKSSVAAIRLFLVDSGMRASINSPADIAQLETAVETALAESPADAFTWLIADWLKRREGEAMTNDMMLRMSYRTGPNEGWVALKRNPIAVASFPSLPGDLVGNVIAEFAGLVQAGFNIDAADVLAHADPGVRGQLLAALVNVNEENRRRFARVLESKNIEVNVPGMAQPRHF
jgi:hypothetical protein